MEINPKIALDWPSSTTQTMQKQRRHSTQRTYAHSVTPKNSVVLTFARLMYSAGDEGDAEYIKLIALNLRRGNV